MSSNLDNIMTKADLNVLSDEIKKYVSDRVGGGTRITLSL